ncbi:hypothetical protein, partial [Bifidobacterium longum]|uniref:hypothetical protein n=3 Tax=Bifidobacterium longum TaxID=216816 RepID=UPI0022790609
METMPKPGFLQGKTIPPLDVMLFGGVVFAVVWCPSCVFLVSVSCLFSSLMADGMVSYRVFLSCFFFFCSSFLFLFFVSFFRFRPRHAPDGAHGAPCQRARLDSRMMLDTPWNSPVRNRIQAWRMRGSAAGRRGLSASSDRLGGSGSVSGRGSCGCVSSRAGGLSAGRGGGSGGSSGTTCQRSSA